MSRDWLDDPALYPGLETEEARAARRALLTRLADAEFSEQQLREAVQEGRLTTLLAEFALAGDAPYTLTQLARATGLDTRFLRQLLLALGRANPARGERAFTEGDREAVRTMRRFIDTGLPTREILEVARVMDHGMANTAVAIRELVARALLDRGGSEHDLALGFAETAEQLGPLLGPLLGHELQVHIRDSIRREAVTQAERDDGALTGARPVAVGFGDLVGFTALGGEVPPDRLGGIAGRLAELASSAARPPAQLVKTIGDAVMFASQEVAPLLDTLLALLTAVEGEGDEFPGLRGGVAYGHALPRGGDWFGAPVNLASRLTASAKPGGIHVSEDAQALVADRYEWSRRRKKSLKGIGRTAYFRLTP